MYKLLCSNVTKSHRSLTNFTQYYRIVAQKYYESAMTGKKFDSEDVEEKIEQGEVQDEVTEGEVPSEMETQLCTDYYRPKIIAKSRLYPSVKERERRSMTIPSRSFHSTNINTKRSNPEMKKPFKSKEAQEYYQTAIEQCMRIKCKLDKYYQQVGYVVQPPKLKSELKREFENIASFKKIESISSLKAKPPKQRKEDKQHKVVPELSKIERIRNAKDNNQFKQTKFKITYPTHTVRYKLGSNKLQHRIKPHALTEQQLKTIVKKPVKEPLVCQQIKHQKASEKELAQVQKIKCKMHQKKLPYVAQYLQKQADEESKLEETRQRKRINPNTIKQHPTVRQANASAKMAVKTSYNKLLKKSGLLYRGPKGSDNNNTRIDGDPSKPPESKTPPPVPVTTTWSYPKINKAEEPSSDVKVMDHPLAATKPVNIEPAAKHPKRILTDKSEIFDIDAMCLKSNSASNVTTNYGDYVVESEERVRNFVETHKQEPKAPVNEPKMKTEVKESKVEVKEVYNYKAPTKVDTIGEYLKKLKELRDQTALDRSRLKKTLEPKKIDLVQKVEANKIQNAVGRSDRHVEKTPHVVETQQTPKAAPKVEPQVPVKEKAQSVAGKDKKAAPNIESIDIASPKTKQYPFSDKFVYKRIADVRPIENEGSVKDKITRRLKPYEEKERSQSAVNLIKEKNLVKRVSPLKGTRSESLPKRMPARSRSPNKVKAMGKPLTEPEKSNSSVTEDTKPEQKKKHNPLSMIMEQYVVQSREAMSMAELKRINRRRRRNREIKLTENVKMQEKKLDNDQRNVMIEGKKEVLDGIQEKHKFRLDTLPNPRNVLNKFEGDYSSKVKESKAQVSKEVSKENAEKAIDSHLAKDVEKISKENTEKTLNTGTKETVDKLSINTILRTRSQYLLTEPPRREEKKEIPQKAIYKFKGEKEVRELKDEVPKVATVNNVNAKDQFISENLGKPSDIVKEQKVEKRFEKAFEKVTDIRKSFEEKKGSLMRLVDTALRQKREPLPRTEKTNEEKTKQKENNMLQGSFEQPKTDAYPNKNKNISAQEQKFQDFKRNDDKVFEEKIVADQKTTINEEKKIFVNNALEQKKVANNALEQKKVVNNALEQKKVANNALQQKKVANYALEQKKVANIVLEEKKVANNALEQKKIANNALEQKKIANNALEQKKVVNNALEQKKVVNNDLEMKKVAKNALEQKKVANHALEQKKVVFNALEQKKVDNNDLEMKRVTNNALEQKKVASNALEQKKVANNVLEQKKIVNNALEHKKIVNNALEQKKVVNNTLEQKKVVNNALEHKKVVNNVLEQNEKQPIKNETKQSTVKTFNEKETSEKFATNEKEHQPSGTSFKHPDTNIPSREEKKAENNLAPEDVTRQKKTPAQLAENMKKSMAAALEEKLPQVLKDAAKAIKKLRQKQSTDILEEQPKQVTEKKSVKQKTDESAKTNSLTSTHNKAQLEETAETVNVSQQMKRKRSKEKWPGGFKTFKQKIAESKSQPTNKEPQKSEVVKTVASERLLKEQLYRTQMENLRKLKVAGTKIVELVEQMEDLKLESEQKSDKSTSPENRPTIRREKPEPKKEKQKKEQPKTKPDIVLPAKGQNDPKMQHKDPDSNYLEMLKRDILEEINKELRKKALDNKELVSVDKIKKCKSLADLAGEQKDKILNEIEVSWNQENSKKKNNLCSKSDIALDPMEEKENIITDNINDNIQQKTKIPLLIIKLKYPPINTKSNENKTDPLKYEDIQVSKRIDDELKPHLFEEFDKPPSPEPIKCLRVKIEDLPTAVEHQENNDTGDKELIPLCDGICPVSQPEKQEAIPVNLYFSKRRRGRIEDDGLKAEPVVEEITQTNTGFIPKDVLWHTQHDLDNCFSKMRRARIEDDQPEMKMKDIEEYQAQEPKVELIDSQGDEPITETSESLSLNVAPSLTEVKINNQEVELQKIQPVSKDVITNVNTQNIIHNTQTNLPIEKQTASEKGDKKVVDSLKTSAIPDKNVCKNQSRNAEQNMIVEMEPETENVEKKSGKTSKEGVVKLTKPKKCKEPIKNKPKSASKIELKKKHSKSLAPKCKTTSHLLNVGRLSKPKSGQLIGKKHTKKRGCVEDVSDCDILANSGIRTKNNVKKLIQAMKKADQELEDILKAYQVYKKPGETAVEKKDKSKMKEEEEMKLERERTQILVKKSQTKERIYKNSIDSKTYVVKNVKDTAKNSSEKSSVASTKTPNLQSKTKVDLPVKRHSITNKKESEPSEKTATKKHYKNLLTSGQKVTKETKKKTPSDATKIEKTSSAVEESPEIKVQEIEVGKDVATATEITAEPVQSTENANKEKEPETTVQLVKTIHSTASKEIAFMNKEKLTSEILSRCKGLGDNNDLCDKSEKSSDASKDVKANGSSGNEDDGGKSEKAADTKLLIRLFSREESGNKIIAASGNEDVEETKTEEIKQKEEVDLPGKRKSSLNVATASEVQVSIAKDTTIHEILTPKIKRMPFKRPHRERNMLTLCQIKEEDEEVEEQPNVEESPQLNQIFENYAVLPQLADINTVQDDDNCDNEKGSSSKKKKKKARFAFSRSPLIDMYEKLTKKQTQEEEELCTIFINHNAITSASAMELTRKVSKKLSKEVVNKNVKTATSKSQRHLKTDQFIPKSLLKASNRRNKAQNNIAQRKLKSKQKSKSLDSKNVATTYLLSGKDNKLNNQPDMDTHEKTHEDKVLKITQNIRKNISHTKYMLEKQLEVLTGVNEVPQRPKALREDLVNLENTSEIRYGKNQKTMAFLDRKLTREVGRMLVQDKSLCNLDKEDELDGFKKVPSQMIHKTEDIPQKRDKTLEEDDKNTRVETTDFIDKVKDTTDILETEQSRVKEDSPVLKKPKEKLYKLRNDYLGNAYRRVKHILSMVKEENKILKRRNMLEEKTKVDKKGQHAENKSKDLQLTDKQASEPNELEKNKQNEKTNEMNKEDTKLEKVEVKKNQLEENTTLSDKTNTNDEIGEKYEEMKTSEESRPEKYRLEPLKRREGEVEPVVKKQRTENEINITDTIEQDLKTLQALKKNLRAHKYKLESLVRAERQIEPEVKKEFKTFDEKEVDQTDDRPKVVETDRVFIGFKTFDSTDTTRMENKFNNTINDVGKKYEEFKTFKESNENSMPNKYKLEPLRRTESEVESDVKKQEIKENETNIMNRIQKDLRKLDDENVRAHKYQLESVVRPEIQKEAKLKKELKKINETNIDESVADRKVSETVLNIIAKGKTAHEDSKNKEHEKNNEKDDNKNQKLTKTRSSTENVKQEVTKQNMALRKPENTETTKTLQEATQEVIKPDQTFDKICFLPKKDRITQEDIYKQNPNTQYSKKEKIGNYKVQNYVKLMSKSQTDIQSKTTKERQLKSTTTPCLTDFYSKPLKKKKYTNSKEKIKYTYTMQKLRQKLINNNAEFSDSIQDNKDNKNIMKLLEENKVKEHLHLKEEQGSKHKNIQVMCNFSAENKKSEKVKQTQYETEIHSTSVPIQKEKEIQTEKIGTNKPVYLNPKISLEQLKERMYMEAKMRKIFEYYLTHRKFFKNKFTKNPKQVSETSFTKTKDDQLLVTTQNKNSDVYLTPPTIFEINQQQTTTTLPSNETNKNDSVCAIQLQQEIENHNKHQQNKTKKTSETSDNHFGHITTEDNITNNVETKTLVPINAIEVCDTIKVMAIPQNQLKKLISDKIDYQEFKNKSVGPLKAKIEEILSKQSIEEQKIHRFNKNLMKHIKQRASQALPQVVPKQGLIPISKTLLDPRMLDVYEMQKTLYKYLATELRQPYHERSTRFSLLKKYNKCEPSGRSCSDKEERFMNVQDEGRPKEILKGTYYIEKLPPNRYQYEKTEAPPKPVPRSCDKLCLPLKNISQVALKPRIEEETTLNKAQSEKIQVVPKIEENVLDKYKGLKITQLNINRRRRAEESFLPMIFGLNKSDAKNLEAKDTYEEAKRQIVEFRYELLRKLHKEFSDMCQKDTNKNVGRFEKVSKYYKSVTEKMKKDIQEEIVGVTSTKSMEELLGPCPKPSFDNVSRYYNSIIKKDKKATKNEASSDKKETDKPNNTKTLIEKLSEQTTELDKSRNDIKGAELVLTKSSKKEDDKGNDPENPGNCN